jgi:hypothetical protein
MDVFQQEGEYATVDGFDVLHFQYEDHWTFCMEPWHEEERGDDRVTLSEWYESSTRKTTDRQPNYSKLPTLYCAECEAPVWHDYLCEACRAAEN